MVFPWITKKMPDFGVPPILGTPPNMKLSMLHLASSPKHHHEGRLRRNELGLRCIAALGVDIGLIPWGIAWHFHHRSYGIDGIEMYLNFQPWVIHGYTKWIRGSNSAKSINPLIFIILPTK